MLIQLTAFSQSGEKDEFKKALISCDIEVRKLSQEISNLKSELLLCDKSDSTKTEAIKALIKEKSLYLLRIDNQDSQIQNLKHLNTSLENSNIVLRENKNQKWIFGLLGIVLGITISKL
jgi:hypothetical protein